jgi:hypothetical protein
VLAEAGDFFQKLLHALAFFFHLTKGYAAPLDESTQRAEPLVIHCLKGWLLCRPISGEFFAAILPKAVS